MEDNFFTILCGFLPYINVNQPQLYIHPLSLEHPLPSPTASHLSRLSQSTRLSSMCHTANSHWLSILHTVMYMFCTISLHWSLRKAFLPLLANLWNSAFKWVYVSFSPLPFTSHLFTAISKASSDSHFGFLHFFFLGMVLIPASCTMSWNSINSSSGTISDLIPLNLFVTSTE